MVIVMDAFERRALLEQIAADRAEAVADIERRRARREAGEPDAAEAWRANMPKLESKHVSEIELRTMALRAEMAQSERKLLDAIAQAVADRALRERKSMVKAVEGLAEEIGAVTGDLQRQINALKAELEALRARSFAEESGEVLDWQRLRSARRDAA